MSLLISLHSFVYLFVREETRSSAPDKNYVPQLIGASRSMNPAKETYQLNDLCFIVNRKAGWKRRVAAHKQLWMANEEWSSEAAAAATATAIGVLSH